MHDPVVTKLCQIPCDGFQTLKGSSFSVVSCRDVVVLFSENLFGGMELEKDWSSFKNYFAKLEIGELRNDPLIVGNIIQYMFKVKRQLNGEDVKRGK